MVWLIGKTENKERGKDLRKLRDAEREANEEPLKRKLRREALIFFKILQYYFFLTITRNHVLLLHANMMTESLKR